MYKKRILFVTLIILMSISAIAFGNKGRDIFVKQDQMDKGFRDQKSTIRMTLINTSGEKIKRIMASKRFETPTDGDLSVIHFLKPNDVKDTGLLTHEHKTRSDDQWLYLPSRKRIKRISSDNKSGSFMGSEFSYEDLGSNEVEKYRYKYLRDEKLNGVACFVVERYPVERSSGYSKIVSWVRKDNHQNFRFDFYDRKRELLKTLYYKKLKKFKGKYWRALRLEMENVQTGKSTTIDFIGMRLGTGLNKSNFTKRSLEK